jgi:hypothetical protein
VPYHFGNGWFGGFLPLISTSLAAATVPGGPLAPALNPGGDPNGNVLIGLIYPIAIALMSVVIGGLLIRETRGTKIWDEVGGEAAGGVPGAVTEATPG